jgi:hypothetical protein
MDYLTAVPESPTERVPESLNSHNLRSTQRTRVLDTTLHHSPRRHTCASAASRLLGLLVNRGVFLLLADDRSNGL